MEVTIVKEFGGSFPTYAPFSIKHVSLYDTKASYKELSRLGVKVTREQLPQIMPTQPFVLDERKTGPLRVLSMSEGTKELEDELTKSVVGVAPCRGCTRSRPARRGSHPS